MDNPLGPTITVVNTVAVPPPVVMIGMAADAVPAGLLVMGACPKLAFALGTTAFAKGMDAATPPWTRGAGIFCTWREASSAYAIKSEEDAL